MESLFKNLKSYCLLLKKTVDAIKKYRNFPFQRSQNIWRKKFNVKKVKWLSQRPESFIFFSMTFFSLKATEEKGDHLVDAERSKLSPLLWKRKVRGIECAKIIASFKQLMTLYQEL